MATILGLNLRQQAIATKLWMSTTWEETERVVQQYGKEAETIRELILLACIDDEVDSVADFNEATDVIDRIRNT